MKNGIKILKKEIGFCSICSEEHELDLCEEMVPNLIKDERVFAIEHYYRCNKYDDENTFMTGEMWNEYLLNCLNAYRVKNDLLTSDDIKKIRNKYGVTQQELAFVLGLGEVTITRYETKQIQEVSNDNMLREINNNAILVLDLLKKNKFKFSEKRYNEISENVKKVIDSETIEYLNEQIIAGEYVDFDTKSFSNGNCLLNIEKINSVLAYVTNEIPGIKKVVLMKILWYIDALSFKKRNKAITGLVYTHMPYGALPIAYDNLLGLKSIYYEHNIDNTYIEYNIYKNPDYKIVGLSKDDKEIIDKVINKFKNFSSSEIADYMHNEKAYKETKNKEIISFALVDELNEF